jgi:ABC-2 type transport system permease protein
VALLLHILKYKALAYIKTSIDLSVRNIFKGVGSLLVFGGFAIGAGMLAFAITNFLLGEQKIGLFLYHRFISMMLFVLFISVNLGNIIVLYATLFKSSEVQYLFTKPIPYITIFILKFLDSFLYSSGTLFLIAFSALVGYGSFFEYSWYYFLLVLLFVFVPFMLISAILAALILMGLMKLAGRYGFRQVLAALGILYCGFIYVFFKFINPIKLVEEVNRYYPNIDEYLSNVGPTFLNYLPNTWVADILFFIARGDLSSSLPLVGFQVALLFVMMVIIFLVAKKLYFRSWLTVFSEQGSRNTVESGRKTKWFDFRKKSLFSAQTEVILKREYFSFFREPTQWIHFGVMLVLVGIFVASIRNLNLTLRVLEIQFVIYLVLFVFGSFMVNAVALRFVFPMYSLEGKQFWTILSSPVNPQKVYLLKLFLAFIVLLILSETIAIFTNFPFVRFTERRPLLMYFGIYSGFWIAFAMTSFNYGMGALFSEFNERNPIRIASTQGATISFLLSLLYLVLCVTIITLPIYSYFESLIVFAKFETQIIIFPGTIFGTLSAIIGAIGLIIGFNSMRRDF